MKSDYHVRLPPPATALVTRQGLTTTSRAPPTTGNSAALLPERPPLPHRLVCVLECRLAVPPSPRVGCLQAGLGRTCTGGSLSGTGRCVRAGLVLPGTDGSLSGTGGVRAGRSQQEPLAAGRLRHPATAEHSPTPQHRLMDPAPHPPAQVWRHLQRTARRQTGGLTESEGQCEWSRINSRRSDFSKGGLGVSCNSVNRVFSTDEDRIPTNDSRIAGEQLIAFKT